MTRPTPSPRRRLHGLIFKLPAMISCVEFEDFILGYLDGDLPRGQRLLFDMHLAVCRECRDYLAAYKAAMAVTKGALARQEIEQLENLPEDLITAVLAARKP